MMIPAYTIPDKLHILVGTGGTGSANLAAGGAGGDTYVALIPNITTSANILLSNVNGSGGGGAGSATGGGAGSNSSIVWATTFTGWGRNVQILGGQTGQAGTTPSTNFEQTRIVGGGAGGAFAAASTQAVGRSITSSYKQPSAVVYSVGAAIGVSGSADSGPNLMSPQPQFFGGAGGAAITSSATVNGGGGGIGCGGGGAGVNLTGGSSRGGRGGDGMVIITCW